MKTWNATNETIQRSWLVVDAAGKTLGRLASAIAVRLRGKHKPEYTPHADAGDHVIVINARQLAVTGNKMRDKQYHWHSGYPGGIKNATLSQMMNKNPCRVLELAIKGMLPKNALGRQMYRKLKIYADAEHPHAAQLPMAVTDI